MQPTKARVAVVCENSSASQVSGNGLFTLRAPRRMPATLVATTESGKIGWQPLAPGAEGSHTVVADREGAWLVLQLEGEENARLAVFHDGVRIHDHTLHAGKESRLVVPAGQVELTLAGNEPVSRGFDLDPGEIARVAL